MILIPFQHLGFLCCTFSNKLALSESVTIVFCLCCSCRWVLHNAESWRLHLDWDWISVNAYGLPGLLWCHLWGPLPAWAGKLFMDHFYFILFFIMHIYLYTWYCDWLHQSQCVLVSWLLQVFYFIFDVFIFYSAYVFIYILLLTTSKPACFDLNFILFCLYFVKCIFIFNIITDYISLFLV